MNNSTTQQINKLTRKTVIYLIIIVALAAGLRTIRAFQQSRYDPDAYLYFFMAKDWSIGGAKYVYSNNPDWIPPLLPFVESSGSYIGLSPEITGLLLGGILGSLMPIAAFIIILNILDVDRSRRKIIDKKLRTLDNMSSDLGSLTSDLGSQTSDLVSQTSDSSTFVINNVFLALFGAFLIAVHPYMIRISVSCMRECLSIPLTCFAVLFAVIAIGRKNLLCWGIFGILTALASMTRKEGVEIIIVFLLWLIVDIVREILSKKSVFNSRPAYAFYLTKVILVTMICFWGLVLPVEKALAGTNCKWNITQTIEKGMKLFK